jgi:hypothetical protein
VTASVIGVRASWTCAKCGATENTFQIAPAMREIKLDTPHRWTRDPETNQTVCGQHGRDQEDIDGQLIESIGHYIRRRGQAG